MIFDLKFFAETVVGYTALWACADPAKHDGYRVRAKFAGGKWTITLERAVGGVYTVLGSSEHVLSEKKHALSLEISKGQLTVRLDAAMILEVADATFTKGHVGVETEGEELAYGTVNITAEGGTLDTLLRNEEPLSNGGKWLKWPWDATIGECTAGFGWTNTAVTSGAYWTPEEFSEAVEEPPEEPPMVRSTKSGVVKRSLR